jgi:hypothetical protein
VVQGIAGRKDAWQPPRVQRVPDKRLAESGRVTSPVVVRGKDPPEFNVVFIQIVTGSKTRESDRFVVGFQRNGPVTQPPAETKVAIDERFSLISGQRAFFENKPHQFWFAKYRDERVAISGLVRPQQNVSGLQNHMCLLLFRSGYVGFGFGVLWFKTGLAPDVVE